MGKKCCMYRKDFGGDYCSGYNIPACPAHCKYEKTRTQQKNEESALITRIFKERPYLYHDFVSNITDEVLIYADEFNKETTAVKGAY